jgi:hypothetical protein
MDIAVSHSGTGIISIFLGYGNLTFTDQKTCSTGSLSSPYSIAVGDLNNDTLVDMVVANYGTDSVGVFLGYGNGSFMNPRFFQLVSVLGHTLSLSMILRDGP